MQLEPGTKLGPYEVVGLLGAGGMGEVYRARDTRLGRDVAVKVLPRAMAADPDRQQRFESEARAAGALNHANIVTLHDVGVADGSPYIVTEVLEGESLRDVIQRGPIAPGRAVELILQLASGLSAAHTKGIVHRDLKPENLFLLTDGRLKILDFGIAKLTRTENASTAETTPVFASLTVAGTIMGTVSYMAPEQLRDRPVDQRADLFAVGAILHEMLTGKQPFTGETAADRVSAILTADPPALPDAVERALPGIGAVTHRLLAKQPNSRLDTASDLAFVLQVLQARSESAPAGDGVSTVDARVDYRQLSFRDGEVGQARFTPDGQTVIYDARWGGEKSEIYLIRIEYPGTSSLGVEDATLAGVSSTAEVAVILRPKDAGGFVTLGTLARLPLVGGRPRELADSVFFADWHPDGRNIAAIRYVGGVFQIEAPLGRVVHKAHGWISHLRYSPDGSMLAFLEHPSMGNNMGYVCVMRPGEPPRRIGGPYETLWRLAWRPDGKEVWFGAEIIDAHLGLEGAALDGTCRRVLAAPGWAVIDDIAKNGDALLGLHRPRMRLEYSSRAGGHETIQDLSTLDWSLLRDMTPDGSTLLMDETGPGSAGVSGVYLRTTDGAPPIRLADGTCTSITEDGSRVIVLTQHGGNALTLVPTGMGEPKTVDLGDLSVSSAAFVPGSPLILVVGSRGQHPRHLYSVNPETGTVAPVDDSFVVGGVAVHVSPDGRRVIARDVDRNLRIVDLATGSNRIVPGHEPGLQPGGWAADSKHLFTWRRDEMPARVERMDVETGSCEPWAEIRPLIRAGASGLNSLRFSTDGERYAYSYVVIDSTLFLARGIR